MYVLLVENNDLAQNESLSSNLEQQGHKVCLAHTPESAIQATAAVWPNLVVFHPVREQIDVLGFQSAINETQLDIPYIFVGNKQQLHQNVTKDTILVAPDKVQQLDQSIKKATARQQGRFLRFPNLTIDCLLYKVLRNNKTFSLTPKEFKLLHLLIAHQNQVISRKTIMQTVWETDYMGDTRTLDVHIRWLREKVEEKPSKPKWLVTIRGVGYRFVVPAENE